MKLPTNWMPEASARGVDPLSGAKLYQLTSAAAISHDIYCEERYTTADGRRIAFLRSRNGAVQETEELWAYDLPTGQAVFVSRDIMGFPTTPLNSDIFYFIARKGAAGRVLMRLNLKTMELDETVDMSGCPQTRWPVCTVSPDEKYFVSNLRVNHDTWGLYRVDIARGTWEVFHEHKDICNPHPQFEPSRGKDILVQWNRDCEWDEEDNFSGPGLCLVGEIGASLYVIDRDGGNFRPLPLGKPLTGPVTGHECWIGASGEVILTTSEVGWNEIHLVKPGDKRSRRLWRGIGSNLAFTHIAASNDGHYFIVDDIYNGRLYIGAIATARLLPLCDTGSSCGGPQYTHPHAYMTPDNRRVIFNSDRTGLGQVWSADLPDGFLAALDLPMP